jgi:predicted nucleic acid-binding protein
MSGRTFFDTNVLVYAVSRDDKRADRAEALLSEGGVVSVQVLNEFAAVAHRKLGMSWPEVIDALTTFRKLCAPPVPVTLETHEAALRITVQYGYGIYDGLILAAALAAGCTTLLSEDMQDGQVIDSKLTIRNPFETRGGRGPRDEEQAR